MIKRTLLAVALAAGSTTAASAETVFVGAIVFTAVTPACTTVRAKDRAASVFHPNIDGNQSTAGLSWVWDFYSRGHAIHSTLPARQNFDGTFRSVQTGGTGWGDAYIWPSTKWAQIRVISYSPALANINSTTPFVTITGQIRRPNNDSGGFACVATFHGTYVKDRWQ
ncbi:MAG: hypothetical protein M9939_19125 [Mesorhizobium sp.]|nr:hypothetical protein [Mesorhizobium sp.]MCO5163251.1 hypothetical protein [Mesorhizobium sp.]